MNKGKSRKKYVIMAVLLVIVSVLYFCSPIHYRLYGGDRIRGTVRIKADGSSYSLKSEDIIFSDTGYVRELTDSYADLGLKGGEYGKYTVELNNPPAGKPIKLDFFQANWWDVKNYELSIDIDTKTGKVCFSGWFDNCGALSRENIDKTVYFDEDIKLLMSST